MLYLDNKNIFEYIKKKNAYHIGKYRYCQILMEHI